MKPIGWIPFVAGRFGRVDAKGKAAGTGIVSVLGIAFGVAALIVILSVMNGLQEGYIHSILEVSSSHARVRASRADLEKIAVQDGVRALYVFTENQALVAGPSGRQASVLVRAVPPDVRERDTGFASALTVADGVFDFSEPGTAVIGRELARRLGIPVGGEFSLLAVSGSADTDLFPRNGKIRAAGTFYTGYYEIDSTFVFVSAETGAQVFGTSARGGKERAAVKLQDPYEDIPFVLETRKNAPAAEVETWRSYNRAFFGALRVEKNALVLVAVLIFLVVAVNLYNSMRRAIYERREDICIFSVAGAPPQEIRRVFLLNGLGIGLTGSVLGLLCGLCISVRIQDVFTAAEVLVNHLAGFASLLAGAEEPPVFRLFDPRYFYMNGLHARIMFPEVLFVFVFGVFSAAAAASIAGRKITAFRPGEILRDE